MPNHNERHGHNPRVTITCTDGQPGRQDFADRLACLAASDNLDFVLSELRAWIPCLSESAAVLRKFAFDGGSPLITAEAAHGMAEAQEQRVLRLKRIVCQIGEEG